ncbi:ankyrin repeat-containing domain protein [Penicillium alfredii]|uniref:Ankyrin repeat-containing domain protein n=1 Tax=Penicillium alfredii TaxID=1506179 RepID=A0A9W9EN73_9EURO|nr:ankyrin repeat-containing domain protein [Penicillium alfredii]KAJ5084907.1 ankyrin repeat-containing domain protein [Penicillium alfredii]
MDQNGGANWLDQFRSKADLAIFLHNHQLNDSAEEAISSALEEAAWANNPEMVTLLLAHGAKITPFTLVGACRSKNVTIFQRFQQYGWDVNTVQFGGTVLRLLASDHTCMRWLLENGADPNFVDQDNATPLETAAVSGSVAELELLISYGAKVDALPRDILPRVMRRDTHAVSVLRFLLNQGLDVNADTLNDSVLHNAVRTGKVECVRILLEYGADCNVRTLEGLTPLAEARECGYVEIEGLLASL